MAEQGISEAASENKPKRGRPSVWVGGVGKLREESRGRRFRALTDRGRSDNAYAVAAITALMGKGGTDKYHWLLGDQAHAYINGKIRTLYEHLGDRFPNRQPAKMSVLTELGRIMAAFSDGEEFALKFADELCEMEPKPKVKEATTWLRRWRLNILGKETPELPHGNAGDLADAFCALVGRYDSEHSGVTVEMVLEALASTTAFYEWVAEEPEEPEEQSA